MTFTFINYSFHEWVHLSLYVSINGLGSDVMVRCDGSVWIRCDGNVRSQKMEFEISKQNILTLISSQTPNPSHPDTTISHQVHITSTSPQHHINTTSTSHHGCSNTAIFV